MNDATVILHKKFHGSISIFLRWGGAFLACSLLFVLPGFGEIQRSLRIQLGRFQHQADAEAYGQKAAGATGLEFQVEPLEGAFAATLGDYRQQDEALKALDRVREQGYPDAKVVEALTQTTERIVHFPIYHIQIDNYRSVEKAVEAEEALKAMGAPDVHRVELGGNYRVRVGRFEDRDRAMEMMKTIRESGYPYSWLVQSEGSRNWTERQLLSLEEPVLTISEETPEQPEPVILLDALYQVMVGPYQDSARAEGVLQALRAADYREVRIVKADGYEVEVGPPVSRARAEALAITLRGKGFVDTGLRSPRKGAVEAVAPAIAASAESQASESDEVKKELERLRAEVEQLQQGPAEAALKQRAAESVEAARKLLESGDVGAARTQFELALGLDPSNPEIIEGLAETRAMLDEAQRTQQKRERVQRLLDEARRMIGEGRNSEARGSFIQVLELDPDNAEAKQGLEQLDQRLETPAPELAAAPESSTRPLAADATAVPTASVAKEIESATRSSQILGLPWPLLSAIAAGFLAVLSILLVVIHRRKRSASPKTVLAPEKPRSAPPAAPAPRTAKEETASAHRPIDLAARMTEKKRPMPLQPTPESKPQPEQPLVEPVPSAVPRDDSSLYPTTVEDEFSAGPVDFSEEKPSWGIEHIEISLPEASSREPELVFEQNLEEGQDVSLLWKGAYAEAELLVGCSPEVPESPVCLRLQKRRGREEVLYCALLPSAEPLPVFEIEVCCPSVSAMPMGIYLESVDNDTVSIPTRFYFDNGSQAMHMQAGTHTIQVRAGQWMRLRYEADLKKGCYTIVLDGKTLEEDIPLPGSANDLDLVSLKADPDAEGLLLFRALRLYRRGKSE